MSWTWIVLGILLFLLVVLGLIAIVIYNRIVTLKNRYQNAFSQIDVQLTRRYDLIPNLVEVAKAYMAHERQTLEAVIQARNQAVSSLRALAANPGDMAATQKLAAAEQGLGGFLGRLFAVSENYPDLKANANMQQLSEEMSSTENRVAFARQAYNDAVTTYNILCEQFPSNIIAGLFSFRIAALLDIEDPVKRQSPKVSFS